VGQTVQKDPAVLQLGNPIIQQDQHTARRLICPATFTDNTGLT